MIVVVLLVGVLIGILIERLLFKHRRHATAVPPLGGLQHAEEPPTGVQPVEVSTPE